MSFITDFKIKDGIVYFKDEEFANFFWSPYSLENDDFLYDVFGILLEENYQKDSLEYKKRLEGIAYAFTHGGTIKSLEIALNILAGVPTNLNINTVVDGFSDREWVAVLHSGNQRTVIDLNGYKLRSFIQEGTKLEPYQPLVEGIEIRDEMNHPRWWDLDYIDILSPLREYRVDESGVRRPLPQNQRRLINEILKHNCFGIRIPADFVAEGGVITVPEVRTFTNKVKPAWLFGLTYIVVNAGDFDSEDPYSSPNFINMSDELKDVDIKLTQNEDSEITENFYAEAVTVAGHNHSHTDPVEITDVDGGGHYHLSETQWDYLVRREGVYHRDLLTVLGVAPGKPAYHFTEEDYNYLTGV